ncbi:MAG: methyltransferase domain-containing protein [Actinomycetota bacterium]
MNEGIQSTYYRSLRQFRWLMAPFILGQHPAVVEYLVRRYGGKSERVLDLGARRSPYTSSLPGLVVGLDLPAEDDARLGFSASSLNRFSRGRHVAVFGRGEAMPFPDNFFDTVLMIEVIEHVEGDEQAVREIRRVLKPGGRLVITTPNGATFPEPAKYHLRHYTPEALRDLVGQELQVERLWQLFPDGLLWKESVRSVQRMLSRGKPLELALHCGAVWLYWLQNLAYILARQVRGTTTLCLVARKPA